MEAEKEGDSAAPERAETVAIPVSSSEADNTEDKDESEETEETTKNASDGEDPIIGENNDAEPEPSLLQNDHYGEHQSCAFCPVVVKTRYGLERHTKSLHPQAIMPCQHCDKVFVFKKALEIHFRLHTRSSDTDFKCPQCHKILMSARRLSSHIVTHSLVVPYACLGCDKQCSTLKTVRKHACSQPEARGPKYNKLVCDICTEIFEYRPSFIHHFKAHFDESLRPQCPRCKLVLDCVEDFNIHWRNHMEGKILPRRVRGKVKKEEPKLSSPAANESSESLRIRLDSEEGSDMSGDNDDDVEGVSSSVEKLTSQLHEAAKGVSVGERSDGQEKPDRPVAQVNDMSESSCGDFAPPVVKRKVGRPKTRVTKEPVVKRPPGRPKTIKPVVASDQVESVKRKPGRPKAVKSIEKEMVKRKPGWPKVHKPVESSGTQTFKRKPDRPRASGKTVEATVKEKPSRAASPVKRKRRRPTLNTLVPAQAADSIVEKAATRNRGPKPKVTDVESDRKEGKSEDNLEMNEETNPIAGRKRKVYAEDNSEIVSKGRRLTRMQSPSRKRKTANDVTEDSAITRDSYSQTVMAYPSTTGGSSFDGTNMLLSPASSTEDEDGEQVIEEASGVKGRGKGVGKKAAGKAKVTDEPTSANRRPKEVARTPAKKLPKAKAREENLSVKSPKKTRSRRLLSPKPPPTTSSTSSDDEHEEKDYNPSASEEPNDDEVFDSLNERFTRLAETAAWASPVPEHSMSSPRRFLTGVDGDEWSREEAEDVDGSRWEELYDRGRLNAVFSQVEGAHSGLDLLELEQQYLLTTTSSPSSSSSSSSPSKRRGRPKQSERPCRKVVRRSDRLNSLCDFIVFLRNPIL